ncbi:uncharacterized protein [Haliotis asinina]|uniref:uncharacterized protein n=1 Tax=Haliotis asinina TaxID=109174 RepID=UPI003531A02C
MAFQVLTFLLLFECMIVVCGYSPHECKTSFNLARVNESLSSKDIISIVNTSDPLDCVSRCFRNSRCVGARFVTSSGQCEMYTIYKTQTAKDKDTSGAKDYIMEAKCGSPNATLSSIYRREGIIATKYSCGYGKAFLGTNDTLACVPPSSSWTTAAGTCIDENTPIRFSGTYLHPVDSGFTVAGTPNGDMFDVVFVTPSSDYPLKMSVNIPELSVFRQIYNSSIWTLAGTDLASPFPFEMEQMFTMEILSTAAEFQCKVNGKMLFTSRHLLPRDSMEEIKIFGLVIIEKILLK